MKPISFLSQDNAQKEKQKTKLSYKEQRDFDMLPDIIEALEHKIELLNKCLQDPACYQEKGVTIIGKELAALEKEYEEKSERYFEILEILESL